MSIQFETVKENIPKGFNVITRSTDENCVSFKLQKRGMSAALSALGIPIFVVGLFSCTAVAGPAVDNGYLDTGSGITLGIISSIAAMGLCIYLIVKMFTEAVTVKITPELIQINDKKYDPKLFGGFMSGQQITEWMNNRMNNTVTEETTVGLSWIYGGQSMSLKGGFSGDRQNPHDSIAFLNRLVREIHPTIK